MSQYCTLCGQWHDTTACPPALLPEPTGMIGQSPEIIEIKRRIERLERAIWGVPTQIDADQPEQEQGK